MPSLLTRDAQKKRARHINKIAQRLLDDVVYRQNLLERLRKGKAGQIEVLLYHYAYGKPIEQTRIEEDRRLTVRIEHVFEGADPAAAIEAVQALPALPAASEIQDGETVTSGGSETSEESTET